MKGNFEILCCEICELSLIKKTGNPVSVTFDCSHEQARSRAKNKLETAEDWMKFDCPYFKEKTNDKATTEEAEEKQD